MIFKTPKPDDAKAAETPEPAAPPAVEPDYYNQLLRLKAEFENYRKRVDREKPEFFRLGKAELLLKLLPIYDLLQLAHDQIQASHADTEFAKGMDGIFKEFQKIFKEEGVMVMEPLGKSYDAQLHEVLGVVPKADCEDGTVVEVLQNGYRLGDRVLRTAKVRIAKKDLSQQKTGGSL